MTFPFQNDYNTPPILVLAHNGTVLLRAGSDLQRPGSSSHLMNPFGGGSYGGGSHDAAAGLYEQTRQGISGYDPEEEDMRGVFMAMGPGELQPEWVVVVLGRVGNRSPTVHER